MKIFSVFFENFENHPRSTKRFLWIIAKYQIVPNDMPLLERILKRIKSPLTR